MEIASNRESEVVFTYKKVYNNAIKTFKISVESFEPRGIKNEWNLRLSNNNLLHEEGLGIYEPEVIVRNKIPIYKVLLKSIFNPFNK